MTRKITWALPASLASGLLLVLAWPNDLFPTLAAGPGVLAFFALIPYLYVWHRSSAWAAGIYAWVMGLVYFSGTLSWLRLLNPNAEVDNLFAWMFFTVYGSLYFALFGLSSRWLHQKYSLPAWPVLALAWTAWEYLRGLLFLGWPWGSLGHTQYANPWVRQLASVAGVGGISFLIVSANAGGFALFRAWTGRHDPRPVKPVRAWLPRSLAAAGILVLALTAWESLQASRLPKTSYRLALIQADIDTVQEWDEAYKQSAFEKMIPWHKQACQMHPDLIVWPESAFPGILGYAPEAEWNEKLIALVREGKTATLLTSNEYSPAHYNSAFLLGPAGEVLSRYRKIRLVPCGEYLPWKWLERYITSAVREPLPIDFVPGREPVVMDWRGLRFSPLICYEDQMEDLGRRFGLNGTRLFISLSNDGWARGTAMPAQHTAMSVFLAVEQRVPMVKVNMIGPTGVVDPWGDFQSLIPPGTGGIQKALVAVSPPFRTFFTRFGNLIPCLCAWLFFGLMIRPGRKPAPAKKLDEPL